MNGVDVDHGEGVRLAAYQHYASAFHGSVEHGVIVVATVAIAREDAGDVVHIGTGHGDGEASEKALAKQGVGICLGGHLDEEGVVLSLASCCQQREKKHGLWGKGEGEKREGEKREGEKMEGENHERKMSPPSERAEVL